MTYDEDEANKHVSFGDIIESKEILIKESQEDTTDKASIYILIIYLKKVFIQTS